jgi:hypothetical protein
VPKSYELRERPEDRKLTNHKVAKTSKSSAKACEDKETTAWEDGVSPGYAVSLE